MYSKDYVGPYECNNAVALCISNADQKELDYVTGQIIRSVQEMLEEIQDQNRN
jgi:hypothetical protein